MRIILFSLIIFAPLSSYGFNSIIFFDPEFQLFIFIEVPLITSVIMAVLETNLIMKELKPGGKTQSQIFRVIFLENIFIFLINFVILGIVVYFTKDVFFKDELQNSPALPLIILIASVYFGGVFIYNSWLIKRKKIMRMADTKILGKPFKSKLFSLNLVSYLLLYGLLYLYLF